MFNTKFQAKVYHSGKVVNQFSFTVSHDSCYNSGEAAVKHLQTIEPGGEVRFNAGATSGNIRHDDGHTCYFQEVW